MVYKNLNIPATLVHTVNGKKYTVKGQLLSIDINESVKTCTMDFNGKIGNNIPLEEVYLNESIVDVLKKAKAGAKAAWAKIVDVVKTVGNFIVAVNADGEKLFQFINTPANVACMQLNPAIKVCPSNDTIAICEQFGMTPNCTDIEEAYADLEDEDVKQANSFFGRIMRRYPTTDESLMETVLAVQAEYYHPLNEMETLNSPAYDNGKTSKFFKGTLAKNPGRYGMRYSAQALTEEICKSIIGQINRVSSAFPRPILVWGAPGVGKSAIIKQAAKLMKQRYNLDLDQITVNCGGIGEQDFALPDVMPTKFGTKVSEDISKSWLPAFNKESFKHDPKLLAEVEEFYNSGEFRHAMISQNILPKAEGAYDPYEWEKTGIQNPSLGGQLTDLDKDNMPSDISKVAKKNGGILFFDEVMRMRHKHLVDTIMGIAGDHKYINLELASKWATICAANRLQDEGRQEDDQEFKDLWDSAAFDRFVHMTYIPTKAEWLSWARLPNEKGRRNVDIAIIKFIEAMPDIVWYGAIDIDGVQEYLGDALKQVYSKLTGKKQEPLTADEFKQWQQWIRDDKNNSLVWNGRTWFDKVHTNYLNDFVNVLFKDCPELLDNCYVTVEDETTDVAGRVHKYNVDELDYSYDEMHGLGTALDKIPRIAWENWAKSVYETMVNNGIHFNSKEEEYIDNDRLAFIKKFLQYIIAQSVNIESIPSIKYAEYLNMADIDEVTIKNIWKRGWAKYRGQGCHAYDDNIYFKSAGEYARIQDIAWKADPQYLGDIINRVVKTVKGIQIQNVTFDYDEITRVCKENGIDPKNPVIKMDDNTINKWLDKYTFTMCDPNGQPYINTDGQPYTVCALTGQKTYATMSAKEKGEMNKAIFVLEHSNVAQQLANVAMWVGKVSLQVHQDSLIKNVMQQQTGKETTLMGTFWKNICAKQDKIVDFQANNTQITIMGPCQIIGKNLSEYKYIDR